MRSILMILRSITKSLFLLILLSLLAFVYIGLQGAALQGAALQGAV